MIWMSYLNTGMGDKIEIDVRRMRDSGVNNSTSLNVSTSVVGVSRIRWKQANVMAFLYNQKRYLWLVFFTRAQCFTGITNGLEFVMHNLRKLAFADAISVHERIEN